jgi:hypothetical protein
MRQKFILDTLRDGFVFFGHTESVNGIHFQKLHPISGKDLAFDLILIQTFEIHLRTANSGIATSHYMGSRH